ncbi:hypothetical protein P3T35_002342, partial [Kitasatospora sp. GP30]|nr:hypothetical protein [Kitasatospora sp. GP30]
PPPPTPPAAPPAPQNRRPPPVIPRGAPPPPPGGPRPPPPGARATGLSAPGAVAGRRSKDEETGIEPVGAAPRTRWQTIQKTPGND